MGANLVPIVRNFSIHTETFQVQGHDFQDGCVTPGTHRVMRFDFLTHNIGDEDLVVGAPADHPEWFVESVAHGHYHLKDFNEFRLFDCFGNQVTKGYKQAFCLMDIEHSSSWGPDQPRFSDCNAYQGVSAGWADLYDASLACQFIVIDGVPDGDYRLESTTNAQRIIPEDTYADNTIHTGLRISGDSVHEISLRSLCSGPYSRWGAAVQILFGVANDAGGVVIPPGGGPIPIDPWGPLVGLSAAKQDALLGLAVTELAALVQGSESSRELHRAGVEVLTNALEEIRREQH